MTSQISIVNTIKGRVSSYEEISKNLYGKKLNDMKKKIDEYHKILKYVDELETENRKLLEEKKKINEENDKIRKQIIEYDNKTYEMKSYIELCVILIKFCNTICKPSYSVKIFGSVVRKLIEKVFMQLDDVSYYGDCRDHDIDIFIYHDVVEFETNYYNFTNLIKAFETFIMFYDNGIIDKSEFGDYIPISIDVKTVKNTYNVHYELCLKRKTDNKIIKIDLVGYNFRGEESHPGGDFDVNCIILNNKGIQIGEIGQLDFLDTLYNIINHKAITSIDFYNHIKNMRSGLRQKKEGHLNIISHFLSTRMKILDGGYKNLEGLMGFPDFYIEKEKDCDITDLPPPYIVIKLECGHNVSIMALTGLINIRNSYSTEQIQCYICRETFIPNIISKEGTFIKIPKQISYAPKKITVPDKKLNIISESNLLYVRDLYNKSKEVHKLMYGTNGTNGIVIPDEEESPANIPQNPSGWYSTVPDVQGSWGELTYAGQEAEAPLVTDLDGAEGRL